MLSEVREINRLQREGNELELLVGGIIEVICKTCGALNHFSIGTELEDETCFTCSEPIIWRAEDEQY